MESIEEVPSDNFADFPEVVDKALSRGLTIHPVRPRDKNPWLNGWPKMASKDPAVIAEWKRRFPTSNYGVVANQEFCILESDDVAQLSSRISRELPPTYTVQARPNRPHMYFRQTSSSLAAGNMDVPGVFEFKQNNRYVVGEGSVHPSGMVYECISAAPICEIPDWLVQDLISLKSGKVTCRENKLGEGEGRHPFLMSQAGLLWDGVKTRDELLDELQACNDQNCDPPRSIDHVADIVDWVMQQDPHVTPPKIEIGGTWGEVATDLDAWAVGQPPRTPILFQTVENEEDKDQPLLYESSINQIVSWRGLGKTNFVLGLAGCLTRGEPLLCFRPSQATRVIYVDGELPILQLSERIRSFFLSPNLLVINPERIPTRESINLLRDSHFARLNQAIDKFNPSVIILDSQSTLMPGDSLRSEYQEARMNRLRALRWKGLCVIEMHHAGKSDLQRGSSRNDDVLDVQIQLKKSPGWEHGQGMCFDLEYEKVRHAAHLEGGITIRLERDETGKSVFTSRPTALEDSVVDRLKAGVSIRKIASDLDVDKGKVQRIKLKAERKGILTLNQRTNERK